MNNEIPGFARTHQGRSPLDPIKGVEGTASPRCFDLELELNAKTEANAKQLGRPGSIAIAPMDTAEAGIAKPFR